MSKLYVNEIAPKTAGTYPVISEMPLPIFEMGFGISEMAFGISEIG